MAYRVGWDHFRNGTRTHVSARYFHTIVFCITVVLICGVGCTWKRVRRRMWWWRVMVLSWWIFTIFLITVSVLIFISSITFTRSWFWWYVVITCPMHVSLKISSFFISDIRTGPITSLCSSSSRERNIIRTSVILKSSRKWWSPGLNWVIISTVSQSSTKHQGLGHFYQCYRGLYSKE